MTAAPPAAPSPAPPAKGRVNYWADAKCAKAFWSQHDLPVFQELVADTIDWAAPKAGETWLDLGCGGGTLSKALWLASGGTIASVLGLDAAEANAGRYAKLDAELAGGSGRIRFAALDFSPGLTPLGDASFDHAISGLSISYAESLDPATNRWTQDAYDRLLSEVGRVLRPGGRFVFSVNVPEPSWWAVGLKSLVGGMRRAERPVKFLKNSARMMKYGAWLKREARAGRFHYLPAHETAAKLKLAGFAAVEHRLSYADQAFVFRAVKGG